MRLSVIIPTLNEERNIQGAILNVRALSPDTQIIVVDGGSSDGTHRLAEPADRLIEAPRGRARQMNAGAAAADGDVLLFLHADTRLPGSALDDIRAALDTEANAGIFRLRFDRRSPLLDFYAAATALRIPAITFGDRGLFIRSDVFAKAGGFDDVPLFEDVMLIRRLARIGRFTFLPSFVTTSARRFEERGALRQQVQNALLWLGFMIGMPPHRLARFYTYESTHR